MPSTFFHPGTLTAEDQIASLHLSRDQLLAVKLSTVAATAEEQGYAEGVVTNTKYGSFPHSTLIGIPWGCQVVASKVDTGTRGRTDISKSKKRKANAISNDGDVNESGQLKQAVAASSGFIHVLPPTPENWTTSLPHRTQVVYTPDYSYVLQRIRARPGSTLIEAGSGSGSFTHAAARAVYQGPISDTAISQGMKTAGRVFTFEFHTERYEKVKVEMIEHGLDGLVTATNRDVYNGGFWVHDKAGKCVSPKANAIFLDLPAPWQALDHLSRREDPNRPSVLDPTMPVHICTFSPCIEQVQKTVSAMRRLGWFEIKMVEIQHKRIDVKRDYTGLMYEGMRGANSYAATVEEAMERLSQVEENARPNYDGKKVDKGLIQKNNHESAPQKYWDRGKLVHRSEPDLKTHTSYLVFAVLPRAWSEEDEAKAKVQNMMSSADVGRSHPKDRKVLKKGAKHGQDSTNSIKA